MYECLTEIESEEYGCDEGIKGQCRWFGVETAQAKCMSWPRCEAIMSDVGDDWWFARGVFNNSIDSVSECTDGVATRRHYQKVLPPTSTRRGVDQPAPGCVSLQPALDNEWCDMNCQVMPDAASCKGYCHCPPAKAAAPSEAMSKAPRDKGPTHRANDKAADHPSKVSSKHASTAPIEGTPSKPFAPWAEKAAKEKAAIAEKAAAKGSSVKPKAAHCTSLNPTMDATWCDLNCQVMPDAASCLGFCLCPPVEDASAPVAQGGGGSHRSVPPSPPRLPTWTAPPPPMPPIDYTIERSGDHVELSPAPNTPPWWTAPPPPASPAVAKKERAESVAKKERTEQPSSGFPPSSPWYAAPDTGPWSKQETEAKVEAEAEAAAAYEIEAEAKATARIEAAADEEAAETAAVEKAAEKVAVQKAERAAVKKAALERAKADAEEAKARDEAEAEIEAQDQSEVEAEAEAAAKAESKADCTSLNPITPAVWCDANCQLQPDAESCSGFCKCPKRSASDGAVAGASGVVYGPDGAPEKLREPKGPPAPEPRIIGGWTDCGDHDWTELSDMAKARASSASAMHARHQRLGTRAIDCVEEEKAISSSLPLQRGLLPHRNPSYDHSWGSTAILPGTFGGATVAPIVGSPEQYDYFWLTFGGENTQSSGWGQNAERDILEAGARGAAFDMEGGVTPDAMMGFIKEMRPKHPDWTFVYVPNAGEEAAAIPYDTKNKGLPDYVAPMLYAGNWNSYPGMDMSGGADSMSGYTLQRLKQVGWPASRTILTYQSFDAARMRQESKGGLLPLLGKLLGDYSVEVGGGQKVHLQGPYAGVLGWPAQCGAADFRCWPTADRANTKEVIEGARSAGLGGAALKIPRVSDSDPPAPPSAPTPPVPRGRCGPLFGGAKCDCSRGEDGGLALWCSSASYCGDTDEHQTDGMPAYDCPKAASAAVAAGGAKGGGDHGARPKPAPQKKCGPDNGGGRCDCSVGEDGTRALYCSSYGWCGDTPEYRDGSPDHDCIQYQQQEEKANFFDGYNSGAAFGGAPTSETEEAHVAAAKARAAAAEARAKVGDEAFKVAEAKARADAAEVRAQAAAAAASADADR